MRLFNIGIKVNNYRSSLKILLSAYACEPHKGSEAGVGWHWAVELSRLRHEVWVITRANNRTAIDAELAHNPHPNLHFIYYDLPDWAKSWKKGGRGIHLYYLLWQWGAYKVAHGLTQKVRFDWVHHITFGVFRHPSFLAFLGVPFIFGPVGGGEAAPYALRKSFPLRGQFIDILRDIANKLAFVDPIARLAYKRASLILCKTSETLSCIPVKYHNKCRIQMEIGIDNSSYAKPISLLNPDNNEDFVRILFVGRLIYLKGLHLGLQAFAKLKRKVSKVTLTVIGSGSDERWLHRIAEHSGIKRYVEWVSWIPQKEVIKAYPLYNIFLFPSLHDSSGNVVLEAILHGLPVVCLDLGGPGTIVNDTCGRVVKTAGKSEAQVIQDLADALITLCEDKELRKRCSTGAKDRALDFQWSHIVRSIYSNPSLNKQKNY